MPSALRGSGMRLSILDKLLSMRSGERNNGDHYLLISHRVTFNKTPLSCLCIITALLKHLLDKHDDVVARFVKQILLGLPTNCVALINGHLTTFTTWEDRS